MAERLVTVRPSGGDYTSLSNAEAGEQDDLAAAGDHLVIEIQGDWSSAADALCVFNGSTTSATSYIEVRTDAANRHAGALDTSLYRISSGAGSNVSLQDGFVHLIGLQILPSSATGIVVLSGGNDCTATDCLIGGTPTSGISAQTSSTVEIECRNCVVWDASTRGFGVTVANGDMWCYNCTAYDCTIGFHQTNGLMTVRNCLAQANATADFSGTFEAASNYNCDEDSTAPGANSFTDTASFTNAGAGDFHLTAALSQQGEDLTSVGVTTDFEGDTRSNWDVGADEIVAAPGGGGITSFRALMGVGF